MTSKTTEDLVTQASDQLTLACSALERLMLDVLGVCGICAEPCYAGIHDEDQGAGGYHRFKRRARPGEKEAEENDNEGDIT